MNQQAASDPLETIETELILKDLEDRKSVV